MKIQDIKEDLCRISELESRIASFIETKVTILAQDDKFGLGGKVMLAYGISAPCFTLSLGEALSQLDGTISSAKAEILKLKAKHNITE
jgi:hypothetical protein